MTQLFESESSRIRSTIAVLEDVSDIAADLCLRLEQLEYVVFRRTTGGAAISEVVNLEPDVILLVIGIPRTNAHRLTTELRKNPSLQRAPIVAVSRLREEIERGWPKGDFDHRLVWPEDESVLQAIIGERTGIGDAGPQVAAHGRVTGTARLLLVEDSAVLAEATAEYLRCSGLDVRIAGSAKEALQTVEVFRPEIILCDLRLPDMSGLDLLQALRLNRDTQGAVLALHSAMSDADLRLLGLETDAQIDLYLTKPLTEEKIQRLLDELGNRHKKTRSQAGTA
jgi:DNA-binding response OmpR family regulator